MSPGCRLHPTQDVLLIPEGTLRLSGPSREVLMRIDGQRDVNAIVEDLLLQFSDANPDEVRRDVLTLLDRLEQRGVIKA
jgi:pyrroloquinoline quinone biosynthesis protein D